MVEVADKRHDVGGRASWIRVAEIRTRRMTSFASTLSRYWFCTLIPTVSLVLVFFWTQRCAAQTSEAAVEKPKENYLELYVNSKEPKHFATVIDRAVRLQQKNLIPIAAVYHIGDFNAVTPEIRAKLWSGKLKLFALSGVPSDVPVTTSPAWVFVTLSGRRIVEGTLAIESFVDEQGAFRDGSRIPDPAAALQATPLQKMEGF